MAFQQCLTWCKFDRPCLHALVDAYQGCFKNSATDGTMYNTKQRYFAGLYTVCFDFDTLLLSSYHSLYLSQCMPYFLIMMNLLHFAFIGEWGMSKISDGRISCNITTIQKSCWQCDRFFVAVLHDCYWCLIIFFYRGLIVVNFVFVLYLLPAIVVSNYLIYCLLKCCFMLLQKSEVKLVLLDSTHLMV